jgi:hypothetical protein
MIRVCADLTAQDSEAEEHRIERWFQRLAPWTEQVTLFRNEGFYERFPAKGQVERVARIHRELARFAGIPPRRKLKLPTTHRREASSCGICRILRIVTAAVQLLRIDLAKGQL